MSDDAKFFEEYQGLVKSIAQRVKAQLNLHSIDLDELVAFGQKGLIEAKARFDPTRGVQFNTFSYYRIRGSMIDGVREMAYLPPRIHALRQAAEAADAALESAGDARTGSPEARASAEATARAIDDTLGKVAASFIMSVVGQGEDDRPDTPEELLMLAERRQQIAGAVAKLPDRERALVQGFYFDGRKFDEVAKELGISKSWASRLHTKALELLKAAIESS